jgi:hypothetical protein
VVDTCGLLLVVLVTGAGVQDRDAARLLLWALRTCFPTIKLLWADGGYSGRRTVRGYERLPAHHAAMVQWAMVIIMTRRLARYHAANKPRP